MTETGEIIYEKIYASPRPPPKISFKDNRMKELGVPTNPTKIKNPIISTGRLVKSEQPSGSLTQKIEKDVWFGFESTNGSTGGPVKSCVPVSVERLDLDKDADENVDADQISKGRLVSGQSIGLFTQRSTSTSSRLAAK